MPSIDNYSYEVGYEHAMNQIFEEQVRVLCDIIEHYPHLWTCGDGYGGDVRVVIDRTFLEYGFPNPPQPEPNTSKRRPISKTKLIQVMQQSDSACVACGSSQDLHIDHVVPVSRGGSNDIDNLQMLCSECNLSKGAKTTDEWDGGKR